MSADLPRPDVPRPVAVVRDFVNTEDHETGTDQLAGVDGFARYLRAEGLGDGDGAVGAAELARARRLRAALRAALESNHDGVAPPVDDLREALAELPVVLDWGPAGAVLRAAGAGARHALSLIAVAAHDCAAEGWWERLKICSADDCAWAYYDHSRNRSRAWCEYGCGNKAKTRAYRERQRLRR